MKKIATIAIVLCIISVGMLSGCVNPLDPKEQFIGTWEISEGEETSIITDIPTAPPRPTMLLIFYRNDTVEYKMVWPDHSSSAFMEYEVTAEYLTLTPTWVQAEEMVFGYNFPSSNILILTDVDTGSPITLNRVS